MGDDRCGMTRICNRMAKTITDVVLVACLDAASRVAAAWSSTPNAGGADALAVFEQVLDASIERAQKA